ncbi:hypothetical protein LCGC14_2006650, partial [marine sediment metagenome]
VRTGGKAAVEFEKSGIFKVIVDLGVEGAKVTDDLRDFHLAWRKAMQITDEVRRTQELGRLNRAFMVSMNEALAAGGLEAQLVINMRDLVFFNAQRTSGAASATAEASAATTAAARAAAEHGEIIAKQLPSFTPGGSAVPGQAETLAEIIRGTVAMAPEGAPLLEALVKDAEALLAKAKGQAPENALTVEFETAVTKVRVASPEARREALIEVETLEAGIRDLIGEPAIAPEVAVEAAVPEEVSPAVAEFDELFPAAPEVIELPPAGEVAPGEAPLAIQEPVAIPEPPPPDTPVTAELLENSPVIRDIGFKEKFRPSRKVFDKMNVPDVWEMAFPAETLATEELRAIRKTINGWRRVTKDPVRRELMWEYLNSGKREIFEKLTFEEKRIAPEARKFLDAWADRHDLPAQQRIGNYIPHLFEAEVQKSLDAGHPLSLQMSKAISEEGTRHLFNPFLQERLGKETGLLKDPWLAIDAYVERSLRTVYYQPILDRIAAYLPFAPPAAADYLKQFTDRLSGKPGKLDRDINNTLRGLAEFLQDKGVRWQWLQRALTEGNPAGMAAYNLASVLYIGWLHKPSTAIRNASQSLLTIAEVGPVNFARGVRLRFTKEGQAALAESFVVRSRRRAVPAAGLDTEFSSLVSTTVQRTALFAFTTVDLELNVKQAFLAGYAEAKDLYPDAPREMWKARGDEVAMDTQFLYTKINAASWSQSAPGRTGAMLTTWTFNFMELATKWAQGTA